MIDESIEWYFIMEFIGRIWKSISCGVGHEMRALLMELETENLQVLQEYTATS